MSGSLYIWNEAEPIQISKEVPNIMVQGISFIAYVENEGLRLTKLEVVSNKTERHHEAVRNFNQVFFNCEQKSRKGNK